MRTTEVNQKIFNVCAISLAINLRKNLKYFPPDLQAEFLTRSDFIEEFENEEDGNENNIRSIEPERDLAN